MSTRDQLVQAVMDRIGAPGSAGTSTDGLITTARLQSFVGDGLNAYQAEADWPWLQATATITTVANTQAYAVPADWLRTIEVRRNDTGQGLGQRQFIDLGNMYPSSDVGPPRDFAVFGDQVWIGPIPSAAFTLNHRYIKLEPALTTGAQSPLLPAAFHPAIVEYATYLALRLDRQEARAQVAHTAWLGWLGRMRDNRRRVQGPQKVTVRPY